MKMISNNLLKRKLSEIYTRLSAFFMVGMILLNAAFMVPVHAAFVGPAVVDTTVAVASALSALGIGVSGNVSNSSWQDMINSIKNGISQDVMGGVTCQQVNSAICYHLTHDFLNSVGMQFNDYISSAQKASSVAADFPIGSSLSQTHLSTPVTLQQIYSAIGSPWDQTGAYQYSDFGNNLKVDGYSLTDKIYWCTSSFNINSTNSWFTVNGTQYGLIIPYYSQIIRNDGSGNITVVQGSSDSSYYPMVEPVSVSKVYLAGYLLSVHFVNTSYWSYYIVNTRGVPSDVRLGPYVNLVQVPATTAASPDTGAAAASVLPKIYANGNSVLTKQGDETATQAVIASLEGTVAGHTTATGTKDGVDVTVPSDANTANPSKLRDATSTQTKVVGQDVADETDKTADDTYNQTNSKDTTPPKAADLPDLKLPTGLQRKFPFCLPWDFMALVNLFNVPAKAPVWTVPVDLDVGLVHVHQSYTYDLNSNHVLDTGLVVFKWFLNLSYTLGLVFLTRKIVM